MCPQRQRGLYAAFDALLLTTLSQGRIGSKVLACPVAGVVMSNCNRTDFGERLANKGSFEF